MNVRDHLDKKWYLSVSVLNSVPPPFPVTK